MSSQQQQQEQLEEITRPPEEVVVDDGKTKEKEKEKEKEKDNKKTSVTKKKTLEIKPNPMEELLKKYKDNINKVESEAKELSEELTGSQLEKALGFEDIEVTDEQMIKDQADYQKKRTAYFRIESRNEWHKIPMFDRYDNRGNSVYRLKSFKFYDYPYEVREVIDTIRAEYEDLNRQKAMWDILKMIRDPEARVVASRFTKAQQKWIDVGRTFLLHMKDEDKEKAHKDFILLMVDAAMYRQETFIPNLRVRSKDTSAEEESSSDDSPSQSGIQ
jgi:hypothetical protein